MNAQPALEAVIATSLASFFRLSEKWGFLVVENDRRHQSSGEEYEALFAARIEGLLADIVSGMGVNPASVDVKGVVMEIAPKLMHSRLRSHEELKSVLIP